MRRLDAAGRLERVEFIRHITTKYGEYSPQESALYQVMNDPAGLRLVNAMCQASADHKAKARKEST